MTQPPSPRPPLPPPRPLLPPLPRLADDDPLTGSELLPFRSRHIRMWRSRALVPIAVAAVVSLFLLTIFQAAQTQGTVLFYEFLLGAFLLYAMFVGLYHYLAERKALAWYLVPAGMTIFFMPAVLLVLFLAAPGLLALKGTTFPTAFVAHLVTAGLPEELVKALPALIGIGIAIRHRRTGRAGNRFTRGLAVYGPVDGILAGAAAGAMFILIETVGLYVPGQVKEVLEQVKGPGAEAQASLSGFMLLFPRVLTGLVGHMAWAGIAGYFIGLVVGHPRAAWKLLPIAWIVPSALHALWNASATTLPLWSLYLSAAFTLFVFLGCALKAKQLEASRLGQPPEGLSVLAWAPPGQAPVTGGLVPPPLPGLAGAMTGTATLLERSVGFTARTAPPLPGAAFGPPPLPPELAAARHEAEIARLRGRVEELSNLLRANAVAVPPERAGEPAPR